MPRRVIVLVAIKNYAADTDTMNDIVVRFRLFADVTLGMSEENILLEFERLIDATCLDKVKITIEEEK